MSQDGSLDGSSVGNSLIRVDGLVGFFAIEEVSDHLDNFGNSCRSSNQNYFVDLVFGNLRIFKDFFDWGHTLLEERHAKLFEFGSGQNDLEIFSVG